MKSVAKYARLCYNKLTKEEFTGVQKSFYIVISVNGKDI